MDEIYQALRAAVTDAQSGTNGQLNFRETSEVAGAVLIYQLVVTYTGGNEFLSLLLLQQSLSHIGQLLYLEYRGRGSDEVPHILATLTVDDQRYDLVYQLGVTRHT